MFYVQINNKFELAVRHKKTKRPEIIVTKHQEHAFRDETKNSIFNLVKIYEQIDYNEELSSSLGVTQGNFAWVGGIKDSSVIFYPDPKGRFKISWVPPQQLQNKVVIKNGIKYPGNLLGGINSILSSVGGIIGEAINLTNDVLDFVKNLLDLISCPVENECPEAEEWDFWRTRK